MNKERQQVASVLVNLARNAGTSGSRYTYMEAARAINNMTEKGFLRHVKLGDWENLKGFGPSIALSIEQYLSKGRVSKTINTPSGRKGRLIIRPGVMLDDGSSRRRKRVPRDKYKAIARVLAMHLKRENVQYEYVGSWRRKEPQIANLDVLVDDRHTVENYVAMLDTHTKLNVKVMSFKEDRVDTVLTYDGEKYKVTLFLGNKRSWGSYVLAHTGSPNFNIFMRTTALGLELRLNKEGLYRGSKKIAGATEELIFKKLKMKFIPATKRNFD